MNIYTKAFLCIIIVLFNFVLLDYVFNHISAWLSVGLFVVSVSAYLVYVPKIYTFLKGKDYEKN